MYSHIISTVFVILLINHCLTEDYDINVNKIDHDKIDHDSMVEEYLGGMTEDDMKNVIQSWARIQANASEYGLTMFIRLFKKIPEIKLMYKRFINSDATEEEMANNVRFRKHIDNVMKSWTQTVANMENSDDLLSTIIDIAEHHQHRGTRRVHLLAFKNEILNLLKDDLKYSDDICKSWRKFFFTIYFYVFSVVEK
ncbi:cytoglobin-2-like [Anticarsia gemmatalis]|uniref:cytoglobin-2-like n=1 Tax=Anticarsia gemmatalis TaxID=129554 RepID=UPI003F760C95